MFQFFNQWNQNNILKSYKMEFLETYNLTGLVIGISTFLIIGLFHPLVIKGEYYFGEKIKWVFAGGGIVFIILTLLVTNVLLSSLFGVTAFSCFWSIMEVKEQVKRVKKGWFPANPKRKKYIK